MKKQMLILKGDSDVGKSTAIKFAFDRFLQCAVQDKQKKKVSTVVHYLYLTKREVAAVIEVERCFIGMATGGDTPKHVQKALDFFTLHRCNVVMCATQSSGKTLEKAQQFASTQLRVTPKELIKKKIEGDTAQQKANLRMASRLLRWSKLAVAHG